MEKVGTCFSAFLSYCLTALIQFGRRIPLIIGGVWQSIWLFVFAAAGTAQDPATSEGVGERKLAST
jgi:MFS transporter, SP family, sugar:H+ symporter